MRRRWFFVAMVCAGMVGSSLLMPALRLRLFPPKLTEAQQQILNQAEAGLAMYATRSPTARAFLQYTRHQSFRTAFMPGAGVARNDSASHPLAVTVFPDDHGSTIASYSTDDIIGFVESKCAKMSHVGLGLIYPHELQHRIDFKNKRYARGDPLSSMPRLETEVRARMASLTILSEYTQGRWDMIVAKHNAMYRRLKPAVRKQKRFANGRYLFKDDVDAIMTELGRLEDADRSYLVQLLYYESGYQLWVDGKDPNPEDSLAQRIRLL